MGGVGLSVVGVVCVVDLETWGPEMMHGGGTVVIHGGFWVCCLGEVGHLLITAGVLWVVNGGY